MAFSKKELGLCSATELELEWRDPKQEPIAQKPYHYSWDDLEFTRKEVEDLLEADLIEEVKSPWA